MPNTDTFFQYLLTLGLTKNRHLHRVVIVNKDDSPELRTRYENVFSRSLIDRGRLIFHSMRFIHFVNTDAMKDIGSNV